jgi:hypothetical protein
MVTEKQREKAFLGWNYLVGVASEGGTVTYANLGAAIGMSARSVTRPLGIIQDYCREAGLPPLTSLVVRSTSRRPGSGLQVEPGDVPQEQARVRAFHWDEEPNPFEAEVPLPSDPTNTWWNADPEERFWLESTDRSDLGANIVAPISNNAYQRLVSHVRPGDIIVHYYQPTHEIVAYSIAEGEPFDSKIRWPDRVYSDESPAFEEAIGHFTFLETPITLEEIRERDEEIRRIKDNLDNAVGGKSVYFPFQIPAVRPVVPAQGAYLTKLPKAVFDLFPELNQAVELRSRLPEASPRVFSSDIPPITPGRKGTGSTGGRQRDVKKKLAAEEHAMVRARAYLEDLGYEVEDVSDQASLGYDLLGIKDTEVVGCEVKGSISSRIGVDVQASEVDFAMEVALPFRSLLYVVDGIELSKVGDDYVAIGGRPREYWDWDPDAGSLTPTAYRYILPF